MNWIIAALIMLFAICILAARVRVSVGITRTPKKGGWINMLHGDQGEVHTIPQDDTMPHIPENCECLPQTVPVPREDGSMGWQVIHNAKDGRE